MPFLFAIILYKGNSASKLRITGQVDQVLQKPFAGIVCRVGFAGKDDLDGAPAVLEMFFKTLQIMVFIFSICYSFPGDEFAIPALDSDNIFLSSSPCTLSFWEKGWDSSSRTLRRSERILCTL